MLITIETVRIGIGQRVKFLVLLRIAEEVAVIKF